MAQDDSTYTKPKLRQRLKDKIQAGDKGGKPGQWSARKAQLLVREYEKAGGGYTSAGKKSGKQEHLADWGKQDWKTASGKDAKDTQPGKGTGRYLPEVAWKLLSKAERERTETRKRDAERQFVENTDAAKEARKAAELLTMKAGDARKAVAAMGSRSQLKRAERAEATFGKGRKTVLAAIEKRRTQV